ncbi:hypothetical protein L914_21511 [Phytophthora nicotianae]|uniref:Uncharacterized protein n=1 Tax=Phytophthora nicotianae TaxID=4792 RepID=W2JU82_PHYNI|nr:hypothetical protein L916_01147 [Phytophthora nicotianae]ETM30813.1 hypothetical protein L914_21511 [Phytophthora nicotianae]
MRTELPNTRPHTSARPSLTPPSLRRLLVQL